MHESDPQNTTIIDAQVTSKNKKSTAIETPYIRTFILYLYMYMNDVVERQVMCNLNWNGKKYN